ncbi:MAG: hypothetical protein Q8O62_04880 [Aequorivita sp.]|nr:hypothetical protein [Aequorivita sp.]
MKLIKKYILAFDTTLAVLFTLLALIFMPLKISAILIKDILGMGIGVLSVIFSIFFAALAFIISASDDDFVEFLERKGLFTRLIDNFNWTVGSLFIALIYSIILYSLCAFELNNKSNFEISEYLVAVFVFLFFYSLIATILSTNDAIRYSKTRIKFVQIMRKKKDEANEEDVKE